VVSGMNEEKLSLREKVKGTVLPRGPQSIAEPEKELRFTRAAQGGVFFACSAVIFAMTVAVFILSTLGWGNSEPLLQGWWWLSLVGMVLCFILMRLGLRCARHAYIILNPLGVEIFPFFKAKDNLQIIYWSQVADAEFPLGAKRLVLHFTEEKNSGVVASLRPIPASRRHLLEEAIMGVLEKRKAEVD